MNSEISADLETLYYPPHPPPPGRDQILRGVVVRGDLLLTVSI